MNSIFIVFSAAIFKNTHLDSFQILFCGLIIQFWLFMYLYHITVVPRINYFEHHFRRNNSSGTNIPGSHYLLVCSIYLVCVGHILDNNMMGLDPNLGTYRVQHFHYQLLQFYYNILWYFFIVLHIRQRLSGYTITSVFILKPSIKMCHRSQDSFQYYYSYHRYKCC